MHQLVFCTDATDLAWLPALAVQTGAGLQCQAFYFPEVLDDPAGEVERHQQALCGFPGLLAMHGPFFGLMPGSYDPLVRQVAAQRIGQGITIAQDIGAEHLVLHHGHYNGPLDDPGWVERSVTFWREILAMAPANMRLHLENVFEPTPALLAQVVRQIGDPRLGICLDIGHAHVASRMPVTEWVAELGSMITFVHLHDNHGTDDLHLPLGQGSILLPDVLAALEANAPQAIWAIETLVPESLTWLNEAGWISQHTSIGAVSQ